ncbi:MAG: lauroyl acyltransferase [Rhodospirillaceae bacterium]|jgi:KDO2-lipid IV(A) lauroyltransferase|nr:lauroyl acyltransferase [Rhodospirillaceae bacterium]
MINFREFKFRSENIIARIVFNIFAILPIDIASSISGWICRTICPHLLVTNYARENLNRIFPNWSNSECEAVIVLMWNNIGRIIGEYPHIHKMTYGFGSRVEVCGIENIVKLRNDGLPGLFFSGHFGNWEIIGPCVVHHGINLHLVYRAATNPYTNWIFMYRSSNDKTEMIPKGISGAKKVIEKLNRGEHIGMIVDQKMNNGISVPFFGIESNTAPALAVFALKYKCPVVPVHVVRLDGAHFRIIFDSPIFFENTSDHNADIKSAMTLINSIIESWIREYPDHWLWLHKRWS